MLGDSREVLILKRTLTDLTLRKIAPQSGTRVEVWDTRLPGFGVRVSESGRKTFVLMYRVNAAKRRMTFGRWPIVSLAEARAMAIAALNKVALGSDPQTVAQEHKAEKVRYGFSEMAGAFVELHCRRHNRQVTRRDTERILKNRFVSEWGSRDIREITKSDVIKILDGIVEAGTPSAANHALAAVRKFFNWCIERGSIERSPCTGIKKPARENSRQRVLRDDELCAVWSAAKAVGPPFGTIVQLLILTGQRRSEVASMRWCDIDLERLVWALPAELTKSNRQHHVPLSPLAEALFQTFARGALNHVFASRSKRTVPFANFSQEKKRIDELSGVTGWTLHDLRRTFSTIHARIGTPPHITERILNHQVGTLTPIAKIYNRYSYLDEMREAMLNYERELLRLFSKEKA